MARPTKYTKALADRICKRISGGESLRSICDSKTMPDKSTVLLWVVNGKHDGFYDQYRQAREAAGYSHADRIINLIDRLDPESNGIDDIDPEDRDAVELAKLRRLDPQTAKVMIDGLKWAAERMAPKAHAARQEIDHTSTDGSMTPKVTAVDPVEAAKQYQDMMAGK